MAGKRIVDSRPEPGIGPQAPRLESKRGWAVLAEGGMSAAQNPYGA